MESYIFWTWSKKWPKHKPANSSSTQKSLKLGEIQIKVPTIYIYYIYISINLSNYLSIIHFFRHTHRIFSFFPHFLFFSRKLHPQTLISTFKFVSVTQRSITDSPDLVPLPIKVITGNFS